jgi:hypothetical protein
MPPGPRHACSAALDQLPDGASSSRSSSAANLRPHHFVEHREQRRPQLALSPAKLRPSLCSHRSKRAQAAHDPDDDTAKHAFRRAGLASQNCSVIEMNRIVHSSLLKVVLRGAAWHPRGLIRHRMPLRCELLPFLFGGLIGCVFGAFLAPNRLQVIFLRQIELGKALICGHSAAR